MKTARRRIAAGRFTLAVVSLLVAATAGADPIVIKRADGADVPLEVYAPEAVEMET